VTGSRLNGGCNAVRCLRKATPHGRSYHSGPGSPAAARIARPRRRPSSGRAPGARGAAPTRAAAQLAVRLRPPPDHPGAARSGVGRRRLDGVASPLQSAPDRLRALDRLSARPDAGACRGHRSLSGRRQRHPTRPAQSAAARHELAAPSRDAGLSVWHPARPALRALGLAAIALGRRLQSRRAAALRPRLSRESRVRRRSSAVQRMGSRLGGVGLDAADA
jgi:hypothetical protein